MIANLIGHWFLGLPVGYGLCFGLGWGVVGIWIGLSLGLIAVGVALLGVWRRRVRHLAQDPAAPGRQPAARACADCFQPSDPQRHPNR
jgi:MATE family multidrug resistance protein